MNIREELKYFLDDDTIANFEQKNEYQYSAYKTNETDKDNYNYYYGLYAYPNDTQWRICGADRITNSGVNKGFEPYKQFHNHAIKDAMRECINHINKELEHEENTFINNVSNCL